MPREKHALQQRRSVVSSGDLVGQLVLIDACGGQEPLDRFAEATESLTADLLVSRYDGHVEPDGSAIALEPQVLAGGQQHRRLILGRSDIDGPHYHLLR